MNRNPIHNAQVNARKALAAKRAQQEKRKRMTRAQIEMARIDEVVRMAKKREQEAIKNRVDMLHYDSRRLSFRAKATKIA